MPSNQRRTKDRLHGNYEKRKSSFQGSHKSANNIPNRPLQGESHLDGKRVLGRSRTYPGSPGRLSQNKVSGKEFRKSASLNDVNLPRFSKLKFGEQLPFVGCHNCTPWVICTDHEAWLTIPGRANYRPLFEANKSPFVHGSSL